MTSKEQIYSSIKKTREILSSVDSKISRREFKEPKFCEIVEENGKCKMKLSFLEEVEVNKDMVSLKRILSEKKENIKKLIKNYIEMQS